MDDCASFPNCTLKVDMEGCEKCAAKLKKNLAKFDGVHGVDVDAEKGLVRVSGKVDHGKLIRKIEEKMKKEVKLLSDDDPIMINRDEDCIEMQKNNAVYVKKDDNDFYDHVPEKIYEDFECKDSHCRFEHKKPIMLGNHNVPTVKHHPPNPDYFPPTQPNLQHPRNYGKPMVPQYGHGGHRLGNEFDCRFPPYHPHWFSSPNAHLFPPAPNLHHPQFYGGPIVPQYDNGGYCPGADHDASHMWPLLRPLPPYDHFGARHMPASNDFTHFFSDENAAGCTIM